MRRMSLLLLVCAVVSTSAFAQSPSVVYSPWIKFCLSGQDEGRRVCFTGRDARIGCLVVASVAVIEQEGDPAATLRMTLPSAADQNRGATLLIDKDQPIARPFTQCNARGCAIEHRTHGQDLVARLRAGRVVAVEGIDTNSQPLHGRFSLQGFAEAYDDPHASISNRPNQSNRRGRECDSDGCYFGDNEAENPQLAQRPHPALEARQAELQRCAEEARKKLEGQR
jgi:invasion protein IalB